MPSNLLRTLPVRLIQPATVCKSENGHPVSQINSRSTILRSQADQRKDAWRDRQPSSWRWPPIFGVQILFRPLRSSLQGLMAMNPFAGKNPTERNKIIAAIVLGFVALTALYLAFGRSMFSGSTTVAVGVTPTPKPSAIALCRTKQWRLFRRRTKNSSFHVPRRSIIDPGMHSLRSPAATSSRFTNRQSLSAVPAAAGTC